MDNILTLITFSPLVGALAIMLVPGDRKDILRTVEIGRAHV